MNTPNNMQLSVSDNGKYFLKDGRPFFWLGDTAWLLALKTSKKQADTYLRNRKELGFNVLQMVLLYNLSSANTPGGMPYGTRDPFSKEYWEFCDYIIDKAAELDMYMALVPAWGYIVKKGVVTEENAPQYAEFLAKRYKDKKNIIWLLGGDIRGSVHPEIYDILGKTFKEYNPNRLISFHPFGRTSSALWFHNRDWLDFNVFQSGHRRYDQEHLGEWDDNAEREEFFAEDCWKYVKRDGALSPTKPILDGEPSYEGILQGLHNKKEPYWEACDVRRYAYWSVFEGGCGFTYGNNAIIQFYDPETEEGSYGVRESWQDAMHYEGSTQLKFLKELMLSVDFQNGAARDDLLLYKQKERYHRIATFAGDDFVFCYTYMGDEFKLDLSDYKDKQMDAYWFNPQNGVYSYIQTLCGEDNITVRPTMRREKSNDWVLVLKKSN